MHADNAVRIPTGKHQKIPGTHRHQSSCGRADGTLAAEHEMKVYDAWGGMVVIGDESALESAAQIEQQSQIGQIKQAAKSVH